MCCCRELKPARSATRQERNTRNRAASNATRCTTGRSARKSPRNLRCRLCALVVARAHLRCAIDLLLRIEQVAYLGGAQPAVPGSPDSTFNFDEQRLCVLHKGHHIGRISLAKHLDLRDARVDLFQIAFGELDLERSHVFLKVANTLRARDGYDVIALSKNPSKGQPCGG